VAGVLRRVVRARQRCMPLGHAWMQPLGCPACMAPPPRVESYSYKHPRKRYSGVATATLLQSEAMIRNQQQLALTANGQASLSRVIGRPALGVRT
jgi:hypothetical protein